jgi:diacylglycerol kinase family enzyme
VGGGPGHPNRYCPPRPPLQLDGDLVDTTAYDRFTLEVLPRAIRVRTQSSAGAGC